METLNDYSFDKLIKLRTYFKELLSEIHSSAYRQDAEYAYSEMDIARIALLEDNIKIVDAVIIRNFQVVKLDTELPSWFESKEKLEERRDEMNKFNSQMV